MLKLLNAYRDAPTTKNAQKVRAYDRNHMMTTVCLSPEKQDLLAKAIHHANGHCVADTCGTIRNGKVKYV